MNLSKQQIEKLLDHVSDIPVVLEKVDKMEKHLERLNGQVAKNTEGRLKQEPVCSFHKKAIQDLKKDLEKYKKEDRSEGKELKEKVSKIAEKLAYIGGGGAVLHYISQFMK